MSRIQAFIKLANETLTTSERHHLNSVLYTAQGYDYIDSILKENGFDRGNSIDKSKFELLRNGHVISNAYLLGDYRGMRVIQQNIKSPQTSRKKKVEEERVFKIPFDAYTSPAALYELWEREKESKLWEREKESKE